MNLRDLMQDFTEKRTAYETLRDSKADVAEQRAAMEAMRSAKEAYVLNLHRTELHTQKTY